MDSDGLTSVGDVLRRIARDGADRPVEPSLEVLARARPSSIIQGQVEALRERREQIQQKLDVAAIRLLGAPNEGYANDVRGEMHLLDIQLRRHDTEIARVQRELELAKRRDALQALRPAGCWCLGLGGRTPFYLDADHPEIVSFQTYCTCHDADRVRFMVAQFKRQRAIRHTTRMFEAMIENERIPAQCLEFTLDTYPNTEETKHVVTRLRQWLESDAWLYLHGPVGVGKTVLSGCLLKELAARGSVPLFIGANALLDEIRATFRDDSPRTALEVVQQYLAADVLVIDDLGTSSPKEWRSDQFYDIINGRYNRACRTIITSNLTLDELRGWLGSQGARIVSRLTERCTVVKIGGETLRKPRNLFDVVKGVFGR